MTFADGTEATATVASEDAENDIAVLEADRAPEVIVPAVLGGSGLRVGDETFAVGHPLGLVGSLSAGVISGLERAIPIGNGQTLEASSSSTPRSTGATRAARCSTATGR